MQFEIPLETVYHTVRFARANGIKCIVNPAPGRPGRSRRAAQRSTTSSPTSARPKRSRGRPVKTHRRSEGCARSILSTAGIPRVIITLGSQRRAARRRRHDRADPGLQGRGQRHHRRRGRVHRQLRDVPCRGRSRTGSDRAGLPYASLSTTKRRHPEIASCARRVRRAEERHGGMSRCRGGVTRCVRSARRCCPWPLRPGGAGVDREGHPGR